MSLTVGAVVRWGVVSTSTSRYCCRAATPPSTWYRSFGQGEGPLNAQVAGSLGAAPTATKEAAESPATVSAERALSANDVPGGITLSQARKPHCGASSFAQTAWYVL